MAFQVNEQFVLFKDTGVLLYDASVGGAGRLIPNGTWALTDSRVKYRKPCRAFLNAYRSRTAWIVQTTSLSEDGWARWRKERSSSIYYMDVFSEGELLALA